MVPDSVRPGFTAEISLPIQGFSARLLELEDGVPARILAELAAPTEEIRASLQRALQAAPKLAYEAQQIYPTPRVQRLVQNAQMEATRLNDEFIGAEHLFVAAVMEPQGFSADLLRAFGIDRERVYQALTQVRGSRRVNDPDAETRYGSLERFSIDLTDIAREGKLDPVVGRAPKSGR